MANQTGREGVGKVREDEGPWRVERWERVEQVWGRKEERAEGR